LAAAASWTEPPPPPLPDCSPTENSPPLFQLKNKNSITKKSLIGAEFLARKALALFPFAFVNGKFLKKTLCKTEKRKLRCTLKIFATIVVDFSGS